MIYVRVFSVFVLFVIFVIVKAGIFHKYVSNKTGQSSVAPQDKYLYQASLRHFDSNKHFCSGSVINPHWILTAAHCVYNMNLLSMYVVVGTQSLRSEGIGFFVSEVIVHKQYNSTSFLNDIALLRVMGFITFNKKVQPILLAETATFSDVTCVLSGWGLFDFSLDNLQHISVKTLSISQCKNVLFEFPIFNKHICTYINTDYETIRGDAGSPLVVGDTQIGIMSWSIPYKNESPIVFTSVFWYIHWINKITLN